jgi:hypothetical protein
MRGLKRLGIVLTGAWLLVIVAIVASTPVHDAGNALHAVPVLAPIVLLWGGGAAAVWILRGFRRRR